MTARSGFLGLVESLAWLERAGLEVAPWRLAATVPEAVAAWRALGAGPVALKAAHPALVHKSDVGGVRLGMGDEAAVRDGAEAMLSLVRRQGEAGQGASGVVVQAMAPKGVEFLVDVRLHPGWGMVLTVGAGGVWTELVADTVSLYGPVSVRRVEGALGRLRSRALWRGGRGGDRMPARAVAHAAVALWRAVAADPEVAEVEVNPLCLLADGRAVAVDARVAPRAPLPALAGRPAVDTAPEGVRRAWRFLRPDSVAVVGASSDPGKLGGRLLAQLLAHGYPGRVYPVHPTAPTVQGRTAYHDLSELPETPDVVAVMLPADRARPSVAQCAALGVPAVLVAASGFAERGGRGRAAQLRLVRAAADTALMGPNAMGTVYTPARTVLTYSNAIPRTPLVEGPLAILSQSGALGGSLAGRAMERGLGLRALVAPGNEGGLGLSEFLLALAQDPGVGVFSLFVESIGDPPAFLRALDEASRGGRPVLVYATGRTQASRRAVSSHTGRLVDDDVAVRLALAAHGAWLVPRLFDLVECAVALSWCRPAPGRRVAVITTSGGAGAVAADALTSAGLRLAALRPGTRAAIARHLPPFASARNPVDITIMAASRADIVEAVLEAACAAPEVDAVLLLLTAGADPGALDVMKAAVRVRDRGRVPVCVARTGPEAVAPLALAYAKEARLPVYAEPESAARALAALAWWGEKLERPRR